MSEAAEDRRERWPHVTPKQERKRTAAIHLIAEWYELQLRNTTDKGGKVSPLEALRMTAAKGKAAGRWGGGQLTARGKQSRGAMGTVVPDIEMSPEDRWLEYLMREINESDPKAAYAAAVYAVEGAHERAWDAIGCSDSTYFKYFNMAVATIVLLERQKMMGMLEGKWRG